MRVLVRQERTGWLEDGILPKRVLGATNDEEGTRVYLGSIWRNARKAYRKVRKVARENEYTISKTDALERTFIWLFASTVAHEILHAILDTVEMPNELQEEVIELMLGMMDRLMIDTRESDWGTDAGDVVTVGWDMWSA